MEQMKDFHNMEQADDQVVEVLGMDGSADFSPEAIFGTTAVVQMGDEAMLDISGMDDNQPWVDTVDMGDVTAVLAGEDYSFFDDDQPDVPSAGLEVAAEPLDEQADVDGLAEVAVEPLSEEAPIPEADDSSLSLDDSSPSVVDDVADDITLMADAF